MKRRDRVRPYKGNSLWLLTFKTMENKFWIVTDEGIEIPITEEQLENLKVEGETLIIG